MVSYVTANGAVTARQVTLHYVTVSMQIQQLDEMLGRLTLGVKPEATKGDISLINQLLTAMTAAWTQRNELAEARTPAFERVLEAANGDHTQADQWIVTVAAEFGVTVTR